MSQPFRILSHQACTGGTVISRVVASAPSVVLLSEISPAGPVPEQRFDPLFPLAQFADLYPDLADEEVLRGELFTRQLAVVRARCEAAGRSFVVREHAHSEAFAQAGRTHTLARSAATLGPVRTVVTVRHPAASFLSLCRAFPDAFDVPFGTYCERYLAYLDDAAPAAVETYEAFCVDPFAVVARMFAAWGMEGATIPDRTAWREVERTGNSGRHSGARRVRPAPFPEVDTKALTAAIRDLSPYNELCERLGYDADVTRYAADLARAALLFDFTLLDRPDRP